MQFKDRIDAGQRLGKALLIYKTEDSIVIGMTRGGIPVANEVAQRLNLPLQAICVRKLGVPNFKELGMGAIAPGIEVLNHQLIRQLNISRAAIDEVLAIENQELKRQMRAYTGRNTLLDLSKKSVIIVDDGVATGVSLRAAILAIKKAGARQIIVGVPVAPPETAIKLSSEVDHFVCLYEPLDFSAVGAYYSLFDQVTDKEVFNLLKNSTS